MAAPKTVKMTAPDGTVVSVREDKVDAMENYGYTKSTTRKTTDK